MFFILSKILQFLLTPVFWIFVLLLGILITKKPKVKKRLTLITIISFYIFTNSFLVGEIVRAWEYGPYPMDSISKTYKVGIVLGGMGEIDETNNFFNFHKSSDRLWHALELYHQGHIEKILLSGGSGSILHPHLKESDYIRDFLIRLDIPEEDILVESKSRNTRENALYSKEILDAYHPNKEYVIITSAFHMKRSLGCFEKAGLSCDYFVTDRYSGHRKFEFDHMFLPQVDALFIWTFMIHEMIGYLVYDIVGYI